MFLSSLNCAVLWLICVSLLSTLVRRNGLSWLELIHPTSRAFPVTYTKNDSTPADAPFVRFRHVVTADKAPDVTAVILNWSRLPNVTKLAHLLCGPLLDDVIAEVIIWNNSPRKLLYKDFAVSSVFSGKLRIFNSPENMYFQARYIACSQAKNEFCYVQDDDYLVLPEVIHAIRARFVEARSQTPSRPSLHLLPPHEHLQTVSRTIQIPEQDTQAHFAWLGYGTMLHRSHAVEFLALMGHLNASDDELKMSDNYFTILSDRGIEIWFDQSIELGGGQPFTAGVEGDDRNNQHIDKASRYLASMIPSTGDSTRYLSSAAITRIPVARAPCLDTSCLLETSIALYMPTSWSWTTARTSNKQEISILGQDRIRTYLDSPLSNAVDGIAETAFCSPEYAKVGDIISLDMLNWQANDTIIEMAWLVDLNTEKILRSIVFESSVDGKIWVPSVRALTCLSTEIKARREHTEMLRECSAQMISGTDSTSARFFRVRLEVDQEVKWQVHEVWLRGMSRTQADT